MTLNRDFDPNECWIACKKCRKGYPRKELGYKRICMGCRNARD